MTAPTSSLLSQFPTLAQELELTAFPLARHLTEFPVSAKPVC